MFSFLFYQNDFFCNMLLSGEKSALFIEKAAGKRSVILTGSLYVCYILFFRFYGPHCKKRRDIQVIQIPLPVHILIQIQQPESCL